MFIALQVKNRINWGAALCPLAAFSVSCAALGYARHPSLGFDGALGGNPAIGAFPWFGAIIAGEDGSPARAPNPQPREKHAGLLHSAAPPSPFGLLEIIPPDPHTARWGWWMHEDGSDCSVLASISEQMVGYGFDVGDSGGNVFLCKRVWFCRWLFG